jgi:excisionase family DNA binding protein
LDEYLNLVEATRYLGVSRMTVYKLIHEGKLATFQSEINRAVRLVRRSDLDRLRKPRAIKKGAEETR